MKTTILYMLIIILPVRADGDFQEMIDLRNKNINISVTVTDGHTAKLLKDAWQLVGGQKEFLMRLSGVLPGDTDKFDVTDDKIIISGEKVFVASTANLITKIILNPSLRPEDFKSILAGAGAPNKMKKFNELREKLGLPGNAAD
ncbi:MAG: hypothetical protein ABI600_12885 [Luteolibacter sp.]